MVDNNRYFKNYKNTQYEDTEGSGIYEVTAKYIEQEEITYKGNLLIEALPPIRDEVQVFHDMMKEPLFSESERNNSEIVRLHSIYRLLDAVFPMANNLEIDSKLSIVMRTGYVNKHIESPQYIRNLRFTSKLINDKEIQQEHKDYICVENNNSFQSSGFLILGISGIGKTTAINKSIAYYPKVIKHEGHGNNKFIFRQIPIIKIECPYDGSIKAVCKEFFYEIDKLLGTNHLKEYGKRSATVDDMVMAMGHLAGYYAIGVLIIDEIQHLKASKTGESTLNFFVSMMNKINLPIVYIGTYKAISQVLSKDFRHARRGLGIGNVEWRFMEDEEYDLFIKRLWKYQWTKEEAELTDEIKDLIFKKSLGITDRVIKLFAATQVEAISIGNEKINLENIRKVADEKFLLTKEMIRAFESRDYGQIVRFEDMYSPDMQKLLVNSTEIIKLREKVKQISENNEMGKIDSKKKVTDDLIVFMSNFGIEQKSLEKIVRKVIDKHGIDKDDAFLKNEVARIVFNENKPTSKKK